jgi:hypothetical protein
MTMMQAGNYYVGDLCYVLHDEWDEVCDLTIKGNQCLDGEFTLKDGRKFATYGTMWGDGLYKDNHGKKYSVDAGLIGCILLNDIDLLNDSNFLHGGQVVEFPIDFVTGGGRGEEGWSGTIQFGSLVIETNPDEDEWEDE